MRPPLFAKFVEKAEAALVAAVEVYNKPSFAYREETFALLAMNAWELLLKAKVLRDAGNDVRSIKVYEPRKTKAGQQSRKLYVKRNRAGNPLTVSLGKCIALLDKSDGSRLASEVKSNLDALIAIRDNAAHYVHASPVLSRQVLEISSASVKNFVILAKRWFDLDLSNSISLVLPLSFLRGTPEVDSVVVSRDESRLIKYLQALAASDTGDSHSAFSVAMRLKVKMERSNLASASKVVVSNDPDAVPVTLTEEDIRQKYPWDYKELTEHLAERYSDFKQNCQFHTLRKPLGGNGKYSLSRYLDPGNPKSSRKDFYSSNVLAVFDKHYTRRK